MTNQANYKKSNSILEIDFKISSKAQRLAGKLLSARNTATRQRFSSDLTKELDRLAEIEECKVKISDTHQYHKKYNGRVVAKQYGYYRIKSSYIYIQNLTAVKGQTLAIKTFFDTLLHEWMHHYDFKKLKLNSIHSKGFYSRIKLLKEALEM